MNEVTTSPIKVFIGPGYLQHAGGNWSRKYCLRYRMYLIPKEVGLKDTNDFAYRNGLSKTAKPNAEVGDEDSG